MHAVPGRADSAFQDRYHFTVGGPVDHERFTTLPAHADRQGCGEADRGHPSPPGI
jgi:hypothetical protein